MKGLMFEKADGELCFVPTDAIVSVKQNGGLFKLSYAKGGYMCSDTLDINELELVDYSDFLFKSRERS